MQISGKVSLTGYMVHVPPPTVPAAPNINSVTYSTVYTSNANISVNVNITPGSDGGYAVAGYTATSIPGYRSNTSTTNVITITNLTRGQAYTFVANAYHIVGSSANSNVSASYTLVQVPAAPTMGTATSTGATTATVSFTAPNNGGATITSYTATSSPGGITATINQAGSGTISITGLTSGTTYTFTVTATNSAGTSDASSGSNQVTYVAPGSTSYPASGSWSFIPTTGMTSVSVVAVGGGGAGRSACYGATGGGGGLGYKNNYPVTPGVPVVIIVGAGGSPGSYSGGDSYFSAPTVVKGGGGTNNPSSGWANGGTQGGAGGSYTGDGGGSGGRGGHTGQGPSYGGTIGPVYAPNAFHGGITGGGGGGAGGYSGTGGIGEGIIAFPSGTGSCIAGDGAGGGGGGGWGFTYVRSGNGPATPQGQTNYAGWGGGGGVGIFGQGSNGAAAIETGGNPACYNSGGRYSPSTFGFATNGPTHGGGGGSGGSQGSVNFPCAYAGVNGTGSGGNYGGGAGAIDNALGGSGAVRVVWPGTTRQFPTTCVSTP